jgi:hypothetical protein
MPEEPSPKVADERFWLGRGAEIVQESAKKLDEGAQRIAAAMGWFWTVYSTAAAATLAFSESSLPLATAVLAASPAMALFLAYALATWASLPIPIQFNVLAPYEIKAAHEKVIATKRRRVAVSLGFGAAAAILTVLAISAFAVAGKRQEPRIGIAITKDGAEVVAGGTTPADTSVLVRVTPAGGGTESRVGRATKGQAFAISVPVPRAATYDVEVSWQAEGRTTVLRESLKYP